MDTINRAVAACGAGTRLLKIALLGLLFVAAPALANVKTINGISVEINPTAVSRGVAYSYQISPTGTGAAAGPYSFLLSSGALPANFTLSASGLISGITCDPQVNGTYTFGVQITAAGGAVANFSGGGSGFSVNVTAGPGSACSITVSVGTLPSTGTVGLSFSGTPTASGGTAPYAWALSGGALPAGLSLAPDTGTVSGIPTAPGTYSFALTATDSAATPSKGTGNYTITVARPTITLAPLTLPGGKEDLAYGPQTITASGGTGPYTFALASGSTLPAGMTLSSGGVLSGTPTVYGTFNFNVDATDAYGSTGTRTYSLTIAQAPTIAVAPATLPDGKELKAYTSTTITGSGGTAPYTYAVTSGALPAGLALSAGVLSGTPTASGSFNVTITATDAEGYTGNRAYSFTVTAAPTITIAPTGLPDGQQNVAYTSTTLTASGGTGPYTYAITSGALPAGLTLSGAVISGTPTALGSFSLTVTATDADGYTGSQAYSFNVNAVATISLAPTTLPDGLQNKPYPTTTITASGGTAPYTYSISGGALPAGLSLSGGVISGTPTVSGSFVVTIQATDATSNTGSQSYSFDVAAQPTITVSPATLPDGLQYKPYTTTTIAASGGTTPYTYAITAGALPAGLALVADVISGTPTDSGAFSLTVTATDANGYTATRSYSFNVTPGPTITLAPATLPNGKQDKAYVSTTVSASGGTAPYTYAVTAGALPAGLSLSGGVISGTPTASGTFNVTVTGTDANGYTGTQAYSFSVAAAPTITLSPATLPDGKINKVYASTTITASGGTAPYSYAMTGGALPAGLSLAGNVISGTPTTSGSFSVTITATDADGYTGVETYTFQVAGVPTIALSPTALPGALQNIAYSQVLSASGGTAPYTYAVSAGALPAGLSLSGGTLSGTATAGGTFNFTVTATDADGYSGSQMYTLEVTAAPTIAISDNGTHIDQGTTYTNAAFLTASGGTAPYTFVVDTAGLPTGIDVNADGTISGFTCSKNGNFTFNATATDANGYTGTASVTLIVNAKPGTTCDALTFAAATLANGTATRSYTYDFAPLVTGGTTPYTIALSAGSLPPGLSLTAAGALSGTATTAGTYAFTLQVTDKKNATATQDFSITIDSPPTITVAPSTLPDGLQNKPYTSTTISASGGTAAYTYAITAGALPAGLTLSGGVISGTPTVSGSFSVTITATDANAFTGSRAYTFSVTAQPTIVLSPATLPDGLQNKAYTSTTISASGGTAPYTYAITAGSLPAGLTLSGGVISGTPTASGSFSVTVTATDANGYTGAQSYSFSITAAPTITVAPASLPNGLQNRPYTSTTISASGGTAPYTYAVTSGALPAGLTLSGGVISGTPTASGSFNVTVTATDANGYTGSQAYSFTVTAAPTLTLSPGTLSPIVQGQSFTQAFTASGGTAPYTYAVTSGSLPPGMSLSSGGSLSGTPTAAGTYTFTITATDANGYTVSTSYTLTVNPPLEAAQKDPVPPVTIDQTVTSFTPVTGTGGTAPLVYAVSPTLPAGLTMDPATGTISGKPTVSTPKTTYTVTITDALGAKATGTFEMEVIVYTVDFTPKSADLGRAGFPVDLTFVGSGGVGPYQFVVESGALPQGVALAANGHLTGRAAAAGSYTVQLRVTDSQGVYSVKEVTLSVDEPRPDPTKDLGVRALQEAQADSIRRFGLAQTQNTVRRLEALRGCSASANQLNLDVQGQGSVSFGQFMRPAKDAGCKEPRSFWIGGTVQFTDGGAYGSHDLATDGITVGMDVRLSDALTIGGGVGYALQPEDNLAAGAQIKGEGYDALAYASWQVMPKVFVEGLFGYGVASFDNTRFIALDNALATASRDTSHWFGSLGIAGAFQAGRTSLQPYLRADYQSANLDAYTERSNSDLALAYDSSTADTARITGGLRASWLLPASFGAIEPMLRLEYRGEDRSGLKQGMRYADGLDGIDYVLRTKSGTESAGIVGAGFGMRFMSGLSAEFELQSSFGSKAVEDQSVGLTLNWGF